MRNTSAKIIKTALIRHGFIQKIYFSVESAEIGLYLGHELLERTADYILVAELFHGLLP